MFAFFFNIKVFPNSEGSWEAFKNKLCNFYIIGFPNMEAAGLICL